MTTFLQNNSLSSLKLFKLNIYCDSHHLLWFLSSYYSIIIILLSSYTLPLPSVTLSVSMAPKLHWSSPFNKNWFLRNWLWRQISSYQYLLPISPFLWLPWHQQLPWSSCEPSNHFWFQWSKFFLTPNSNLASPRIIPKALLFCYLTFTSLLIWSVFKSWNIPFMSLASTYYSSYCPVYSTLCAPYTARTPGSSSDSSSSIYLKHQLSFSWFLSGLKLVLNNPKNLGVSSGAWLYLCLSSF